MSSEPSRRVFTFRLLVVTLVLLVMGVVSLILGIFLLAAVDFAGTVLFFLLWVRRRWFESPETNG